MRSMVRFALKKFFTSGLKIMAAQVVLGVIFLILWRVPQWQAEYVKEYPYQLAKLTDEYRKLSVVKKVDRWTFTSIINETHHLIADLNITILRPEEPGSLITQGGDIDNRLKTLLDALTIPKSNQIPRGDSAGDDEQPCHCLLEDDNLITGLNVTVDRLLRSGASDPDPSEVLMMICVDVSATRGTLKNLELSI